MSQSDAESSTTRVVIAEGRAPVRSAIISLLDVLHGFEAVGVAATGKEAIDRVLETAPDLLVIDAGMPLLSGLKVAARIRTLRPDTGIVILSADPVAATQAYAAGADGFLLKGDPIEVLVTEIERCGTLGRSRGRGRAAACAPVSHIWVGGPPHTAQTMERPNHRFSWTETDLPEEAETNGFLQSGSRETEDRTREPDGDRESEGGEP